MNRVSLFVAALAATLGCAAQQHIEAVIGQISSSRDANVTYVERRDDSHRLYRTTMVINISDPQVYQRLVQAFEADRTTTYYATRGNNFFRYCFNNGDGKSDYTLTSDEHSGSYSLVKQWRATSDEDDD